MTAATEEEEAEARNEENRFKSRDNFEEKIMEERQFDHVKSLPWKPKTRAQYSPSPCFLAHQPLRRPFFLRC